PGDSFAVAQVTVTLERDVGEDEVLSEGHQLFDETGTIVKRVDTLGVLGPTAASTVPVAAPPQAPATVAVTPARALSIGAPATPPAGRPAPWSEARRRGDVRGEAVRGRATAARRSGRDRRGGKFVRLLTEISKTLVTVQPLEQVLARVVDLVFEVLAAER